MTVLNEPSENKAVGLATSKLRNPGLEVKVSDQDQALRISCLERQLTLQLRTVLVASSFPSAATVASMFSVAPAGPAQIWPDSNVSGAASTPKLATAADMTKAGPLKAVALP